VTRFRIFDHRYLETMLGHDARVVIASRNPERLRAAAADLAAKIGQDCPDVRRPVDRKVGRLRDVVAERFGPATILVRAGHHIDERRRGNTQWRPST
jgi:NAD(P)-dependent dehydrogenase (short-subunit alcohol dehydrogenase family)